MLFHYWEVTRAMLFKLSFSNMKKSLKDYAVYFFTLILGVAIFYLFNAIETQTTMLKISEDTREIVKLINTTLAFEYSTVDADITSRVDSVLNPTSGTITADSIDKLIIEKDKVDPSLTKIVCRN